MRHKNVIDELDALLPDTPYARPGGSLLLMVGLPASGKSSIVEQLQKSLPFVLISTDGIRAQISYQPTYTLSEMTNIYEVSYKLIEKRLRRGQRVVFDASNYLAARRDHVIGLAQGYGAPVAVCLVQASQEMVRQRLLQRVHDLNAEGGLLARDRSDDKT